MHPQHYTGVFTLTIQPYGDDERLRHDFQFEGTLEQLRHALHDYVDVTLAKLTQQPQQPALAVGTKTLDAITQPLEGPKDCTRETIRDAVCAWQQRFHRPPRTITWSCAGYTELSRQEWFMDRQLRLQNMYSYVTSPPQLWGMNIVLDPQLPNTVAFQLT